MPLDLVSLALATQLSPELEANNVNTNLGNEFSLIVGSSILRLHIAFPMDSSTVGQMQTIQECQTVHSVVGSMSTLQILYGICTIESWPLSLSSVERSGLRVLD